MLLIRNFSNANKRSWCKLTFFSRHFRVCDKQSDFIRTFSTSKYSSKSNLTSYNPQRRNRGRKETQGELPSKRKNTSQNFLGNCMEKKFLFLKNTWLIPFLSHLPEPYCDSILPHTAAVGVFCVSAFHCVLLSFLRDTLDQVIPIFFYHIATFSEFLWESILPEQQVKKKRINIQGRPSIQVYIVLIYSLSHFHRTYIWKHSG